MAVQTQQGSLAATLGNALVEANKQSAGKPLDLGQQRLPPGIKNGVARVTSLTLKKAEKKSKYPEGQWYLSCTGVCVFPVDFNGVRILNRQTFFQLPVCAMPARPEYNKPATSLQDNYHRFQSFLVDLGAQPCNPALDSNGILIHWQAQMKALTSPQRATGPVYVSFETSEFTPGKSPANPNPSPITIERWFSKAEFKQEHRGHNLISSNNGTASSPTDTPPEMGADGLPLHPPGEGGDGDETLEQEVERLVAIGTDDPDGDTPEGAEAGQRLQQLALDNGWTQEQITAGTWAEVGGMALAGPEEVEQAAGEGTIEVGSRVMYATRDARGNKLKNSKNQEFPALEYEVTGISDDGQTCTLKKVKDGKDLVDTRSKKPINVKVEWLE